jgi:signal transduction histidine kinase
MSKTIDDFRDFFKPDKEKKEFSIYETIQHLLTLIKPEFEKHNIQIELNFDKNIHIYGFQNEFSQALLNILNNAKDALIENQLFERKITITLKESNSHIVFSIKDNAGGIPDEIIEKIFEPYFSTKEKHGTGIGLYMTKIIIEEHMDGEIKAYNDNEGAVFEISFKTA